MTNDDWRDYPVLHLRNHLGRTARQLHEDGFVQLGDVAAAPISRLKQVPGIGKQSLQHLLEVLGFALAGKLEPDDPTMEQQARRMFGP